MIRVEQRFKSFLPPEVDRVNELLRQLSDTHIDISPDTMNFIFQPSRSESAVFVIAVDCDTGRIMGIATLCICYRLKGSVGEIHDVVVEEGSRGLKIGRTMMELLLTKARERNLIQLNLTSRAEREAAHALYKSLGFEERDTVVLRKLF